ncbi:hypothetical protein DVH26_03315 [Paenibacillus sp. H1-7]|nr:hypothetical protein DVH26_03315 [Paenibacillus sp. H1-7]
MASVACKAGFPAYRARFRSSAACKAIFPAYSGAFCSVCGIDGSVRRVFRLTERVSDPAQPVNRFFRLTAELSARFAASSAL